MEKLLNSLGAHCLSTSQWADGWTIQSQRGGWRQEPLCWVVPCFTSEGRGLPSQHPQPHFPFGSRPLPSTERGLLRKAEPRQLEDGRSRRWRGQRRPRQALLAVCALGSLASGWRSSARLPWGGWSPIPTSLPETLPPSRLSLQSWTQVPKKAMIQDREAEPTGLLYKKRGWAMDSGNSETNLTLVFRLFQTIKIKAGLRWLPSSESCYVFLIWQG